MVNQFYARSRSWYLRAQWRRRVPAQLYRDRGFLRAKAARLPGEARTTGSFMLKAFMQAESSVILRPTADDERYVSGQVQIRSLM
jgi:hypothetical protein